MFGSSRQKRYGLVLSVEAGCVSGLIVESDTESNLSQLVFSAQKPLIGTGNSGQIRDLVRSLSAEIAQNGQRALSLRNPKARLTAVVAVCGAPFAATIARKVEFKDDTPFEIDAALLKNLQKAAESESSSDADKAPEFTVAEHAVVDTKVNGYDIDTPIGTTGTLLELTLVSCLVSKEVKSILEEAAEKIVPGISIDFSTHVFATYCVIRDAYPEDRSFSFVRAGGEATEIGIVQKDALLESADVLFGTETLFRSICAQKQAPQSHIRSQLCLHQEGIMDEAAFRELESYAKEYREALAPALKTISSKHPMPRTVYLLSGTSSGPFIAQQLLQALKTASSQAYLQAPQSRLAIPESANIFEAVLVRFFHKLNEENRL